MQVVVADLEFKKLSVKESSGAQLVINNDKTRIAAVRETGKDGKRVIEFSFAEPDKVKEGPHYDDIAYLTFGGDGLSVAYAALKSGTRNVVLNGREEALPHANLIGVPVILPDQKGIGCIMAGEDGAFLHQAFLQGGTKQKRYEDAADLVYNKDGSLQARIPLRIRTLPAPGIGPHLSQPARSPRS